MEIMYQENPRRLLEQREFFMLFISLQTEFACFNLMILSLIVRRILVLLVFVSIMAFLFKSLYFCYQRHSAKLSGLVILPVRGHVAPLPELIVSPVPPLKHKRRTYDRSPE